ncbi:PrgI family protein [Candidatus Saccharibacteria bacterium]|nr:PrgI family protein [Candidatus Saccharibacteria bacterium]
MAQYKVPQDVEADDKLLGPFSFRQFVYLLIAAGLAAMAVGLFQLFPLLAIIPVPFVFFFLALALPLKKDQPMETYLAAIVSYHLKPRARWWMPGQRENTILITAPKKVDENRTRDISGEEATHRLSFLADIVDTGGYAIKGVGSSPMREDLVAEANATPDMFETYQSQVLNRVIDQDKMSRHETAVKEMREAIKRNSEAEKIPDEPEPEPELEIKVVPETDNDEELNEDKMLYEPILVPSSDKKDSDTDFTSVSLRDSAILKPDKDITNTEVLVRPQNDSIMELANNTDFSVATIAKEANRINRKEKSGEVFISLH